MLILLSVSSWAGFIGVQPVGLFRNSHSEGAHVGNLRLCGRYLEIPNFVFVNLCFQREVRCDNGACTGDLEPGLGDDSASLSFPAFLSLLPLGALGHLASPFLPLSRDCCHTPPVWSPVLTVEVVSSWKLGIDPPTLREVPCFHSALSPANYVASLGISLNFLV